MRHALPAVLLLLLLLPARADAFEPAPTHAGLTGRAMLMSKLHKFLRRGGWQLGLFQRLQLDPDASSRRELARLLRDTRRLDPAGGYAPDDKHGLRAAGWCMAGSVLAQRPSSLDRHHFYCPALRKGLDDGAPLLGPVLGFLAMLEGEDSVREFFTGTGFDLTGTSAIRWIDHGHNPWSVRVFHDELAASASSKTPAERDHHLAMALMAMGGVLHVLQDMASPTHVRNDFRVGHLQRLGSSAFDRGSAFERYVAQRYGQFGLPRQVGPPVRRKRLVEYFTSKSWHGLADITHVDNFSPGTLPPPIQLLEDSDPAELARRLSDKLRFAKPSVHSIDLRCARRGHRCYLTGKHGPQAAYHIDRDGRLVFNLDRRCHAASARQLLPLAIRFSAGLIDYLTRGQVGLTATRDGYVLTNSGAAIASGTATLFAEDKQGRRTRLRDLELKLPADGADVLAEFPLETPAGARALCVLVQGKDGNGERLTAVTRLELKAPAPAK